MIKTENALRLGQPLTTTGPGTAIQFATGGPGGLDDRCRMIVEAQRATEDVVEEPWTKANQLEAETTGGSFQARAA